MIKSMEGCPDLREIGYGGCVFLRGVQIFVTLIDEDSSAANSTTLDSVSGQCQWTVMIDETSE